MSCCKTYDPCLDGKLNQIGSYASVARQSAESSATSATQSAASATQAAASAAEAASIAELGIFFLGPHDVPPTTDNEGGPLQEGMIYYNTVSNGLFVWNGTVWASSDFNEFTNFTATGTTTARNLVTRMADVVNVRDFGVIGDGVADDTVAFQSAITFAANAGGGTVYIPFGTEMLIASSNIDIDANVSIVGPIKNVAEQLDLNGNYANVKATIYLSSSYTINLKDGSSIEGLYIIQDILKNQFPLDTISKINAAVASYAGTAITVDGQDTRMRDLAIFGFNQAIYSKAIIGSGRPRERHKINNILIDCTNGILIDRSSDVTRIESVHCWPFLNSRVPGSLSRRTGSAFKAITSADHIMYSNCFSYGWDIGFDVGCPYGALLVNCSADGASIGAGQVGFEFSGGSTSILVSNCMASGVDIGMLFNTSGTASVSNCDFHDNYVHLKSDNHSSLSIVGSSFKGTSGGINRCIELNNPNTGNTQITGNCFSSGGVAFAVSSSATTNLNLSSNDFLNGTSNGIGEKSVVDGAGGTNGNVNNNYYSHNNSNTGRINNYYLTAGSSISPATPTSAGAQIFRINSHIYDGSLYQTNASIRLVAEGLPTIGDTPGRLVVSTNQLNSNIDRIAVTKNGNLIPLSDDAYTCGENGLRWSQIWAANGTIQTSDERAKTEIETSALGLEFINSLRPVSYKWIEGGKKVIRQVYRDAEGNECSPTEDGAYPAEIITESITGNRTHWGLLAQEVKAALPEGVDFGGWVLTDKDDLDSQQALRYDQFIAPLIKAVQELSERVKELESK